MRFFNIPCSRAYCTNSAFVFTPRCVHDRVFVKGHGAARLPRGGPAEFLHRATFREELQHFALARGQLLRGRFPLLRRSQDAEWHAFSYERRDVSLAREIASTPATCSGEQRAMEEFQRSVGAVELIFLGAGGTGSVKNIAMIRSRPSARTNSRNAHIDEQQDEQPELHGPEMRPDNF